MANQAVQQMEAKTLAGYAALKGAERADLIDYYRAVPHGRWGPVSEAGQAWARRVLCVLGASA